MYDDPILPPKTGRPVPPPPGFDSWQAWGKAGCPELDDQVEPDVPVPRLHRLAAEVPTVPVRQLNLGEHQPEESERDFFGRPLARRRRKKPAPA